MSTFAVVSQALTMIGEHHHQRPAVHPRPRQEFQKSPEGVVHISEFLVVFALGSAGAVGSGCVVGLMKIKQVHEKKKRATGIELQPMFRAEDHLRCGPLQVKRAPDGTRVKRTVVSLESLGQTKTAFQEVSAYESCGG